MNGILRVQLTIAVIFIMLSIALPAFAYGSSSEDLIGAFSLQKTIKLASSSECFPSSKASDPLSPPQAPLAGALADDQPPGLVNFGFGPETVSSESDQAINFSAHVIDDESGMWASAAYFASPSRNQTAMALFRPENRTFGNSRDGVYTARMQLPEDGDGKIETGYWQLVNLTMADGENNRRILQADDMARLGLPFRLLVT